jgi:hypothetical protein
VIYKLIIEKYITWGTLGLQLWILYAF